MTRLLGNSSADMGVLSDRKYFLPLYLPFNKPSLVISNIWDNAEFKKVWDEFWHWFDRIRMAEIEEQQQNPE